MRLPHIILGIASILFLMIGTQVNAAEKRTFTIGVEDLNYYPLYFYDKAKGEYTGISSRILDKFAASKGYKFEYKPYPINRLFKAFTAGEVDFKFPDNPYWQADEKKGVKIVYSDKVLNYIDGVSVKPENAGKGVASLKTLGSVLGFTAWDYLDKIKDGSVKLQENADLEALIKQAANGRVDGAYANVDVVSYRLKKMGQVGAIVYDSKLPHTDGKYLISTVKHPEVIEEFNKWLAANQTEIAKDKVEFGIK